MNLTTNFFQYVFEHSKESSNTFLIDGKNKFNYQYLYDKAFNLANYLKNTNREEGKYFLLCADNSIFFIITYFSIIGSGNVVVPIHPQTSSNTIEFILSNLKIENVFTQTKYLHKFESFKQIKLFYTDKDDPDNENRPNIINYGKNFDFKIKYNIDDNYLPNVAVIIFTSGSTGTPKGVMLSHKNLIANTESIIKYLELSENDIMMEILPYSYCYGASWLHTISRVGGTNVLYNKFMIINKLLAEINNNNCTGFAGVPSHFQMLLRNSKIKEIKFPTLRFVAQAGGKLANVFIEELVKTLPTTKIYIMYGQTEATARLSYLPPELLHSKLGSIGKGIPDVSLEVLNKDGTPVSKDEIGSIVATGDNVMVGYWNDPEETSKTIINGKLWTGDLAKVDEDGFIYIVDREKHFIKSGGYRISPKEIEDHIVKLDYVIECAVIGVTDDLLGEAPKAYVVLKKFQEELANTYRDQILSHCKSYLASFKIPKYIEFIKALPKNTSNKVLVNELKKLNK